MRAHLLAATVATVLCTSIGWSQTPPPPASSPPPGGESSSPPPPTPTAAQQAALIHYERGRAYYAAGRYRMAVNELETAVQLDPTGFNLFFDLGLVYERLGDVDRAVSAYRHYLDHVSDPAERERGERILFRVRGARSEMEDMHRGRGDADAWFWLTASLSLSAIATGVVVLETAHGTDQTAHVGGDVLVAAGAGLAVTAALLYFVRFASPRHTPRCITAGRAGLGFAF